MTHQMRCRWCRKRRGKLHSKGCIWGGTVQKLHCETSAGFFRRIRNYFKTVTRRWS